MTLTEFINPFWNWVSTNYVVIIGVVAFAVVVGLAFYGARKVETD